MTDVLSIPEQPAALERVEQQLERRTVEAATTGGDLSAYGGSAEGGKLAATAPPTVAAPPRAEGAAQAQKSALQTDIEEILADRKLREMYGTLAPEQQAAFGVAAKKVAASVEADIARHAFDPVQALHRMTQWFRGLPGIDPMFLEQEAQLKASALLELSRRNAA